MSTSHLRTGSKQVLVRNGYDDYRTYGDGYYAAATGNLDAPDYMAQGSVRIHNTMHPNPVASAGHRDWDSGHMPLGYGHDGQKAANLDLYLSA